MGAVKSALVILKVFEYSGIYCVKIHYIEMNGTGRKGC